MLALLGLYPQQSRPTFQMPLPPNLTDENPSNSTSPPPSSTIPVLNAEIPAISSPSLHLHLLPLLSIQYNRSSMRPVSVASRATSSSIHQSNADYVDTPAQASEGLVRRWTVVAGSTALIWATYGLLASNGVFLSYWSSNQLADTPNSTVAWINGVHLFLTWFLALPIGIVFDKHGSNVLLIVGSILYLAGIFGMAESSRFWHFMTTYGIVAGVGSAILSTVAVSVLGHWFDKGKGLATGVVILGGSLGGVVFPLTLRPLFGKIGWSWSIRALALFITILIGFGGLVVRSRASLRRAQAIPVRTVLRPNFLLVTLGTGG